MINNKILLLILIVITITTSHAFNSDGEGKKQQKFKIDMIDKEYLAEYSVFNNDDGTFKVIQGIQSGAVAYAFYQGEQKYNGWSYLSINTSSSFSDNIQASAAGYVEGYLSYEMIYNSRLNYLSNTFNSTEIPERLVQWIDDSISFMKTSIYNATQSGSGSEDSQYWIQIGLTLNQVEAMVQGFNDGVVQSNNPEIKDFTITIEDIFILNMYGDLFEIIPALNLTNFNLTTQEQIQTYLRRNSHCTSMVKLTDDQSEIYASHTTFDVYFMTIRIFKAYYFSFSAESGIVTRSIMFSSYPGVVVSIDDFYQMDSGLVVLETTNSLVTSDLYHLIHPQSVLYWLRIMNANRLSNSPLEWCQTFAKYNSGTYNNQYVILDYKKFTPYVGLNEGGLYVLEQVPGYVEYTDVTDILRTGYFPGFNIPFFYDIYNISGYNSINNNTQYTYQGAPRAQIFRRQVNDIHSLDDAMRFMRYNGYLEHDPLSYNNPGNAICARYDLDPENPSAGGCLDTKITSYSLYKSGQVIAISGPTTYNGLPPFDWNSRDWNTSHTGVIAYWNYDWVTFTNSTYTDF